MLVLSPTGSYHFHQGQAAWLKWAFLPQASQPRRGRPCILTVLIGSKITHYSWPLNAGPLPDVVPLKRLWRP